MKYILLLLVLACGRAETLQSKYMSDPAVVWLMNDMKHRHDSIRRFNEIYLKLDSLWLLHALVGSDSAWQHYYTDSINHYWGIVQRERAAQEKKGIVATGPVTITWGPVATVPDDLDSVKISLSSSKPAQ